MSAKSLLFTTIAACFVSSASAITIASYDFSIGPDGSRGFASEVRLWCGYGYTNSVFSSYSFKPEDSGKTFSITEASDPGFRDVAALLTNGSDDYFWLVSGTASGGGGIAMLESRFFGLKPDLAGFSIESMELRLDKLSMSYGDGWTSYTCAGRLSVLGQPVPDTNVGMLCLAGVLVGFAAWRSRLS